MNGKEGYQHPWKTGDGAVSNWKLFLWFLAILLLGFGILFYMPQKTPDQRAVKANLLQKRICEAFCDTGDVGIAARTWLHLEAPPSKTERNLPAAFSFIRTCQDLSLDWEWLNAALKEAIKLDGSIGLVGEAGSIAATKENLPQFCEACYTQIKLIK